MRSYVYTMVLVTTLAVAGASFAASPSFDEVDRNKDGKLSESEASQVEGLDFVKADTLRDGALDRAEYEAAVS